MSNLLIGVIGVFGLFLSILLGVNVFVALGIIGVVGLGCLVGLNAATSVLATVFFDYHSVVVVLHVVHALSRFAHTCRQIDASGFTFACL